MIADFEKSLRGKKREISGFHAQELLLEYLENRLDSDRIQAMIKYLESSPEAQKKLKFLTHAKDYCGHLSRIEVSLNIVHKVQSAQFGLEKWMTQASWKRWPEPLRWSLEAILVAGVFASVISLLPMHKFIRWFPSGTHDVILAEVTPAAKNAELETRLPDPPEPAEKETPGSHEIKAPSLTSNQKEMTVANSPSASQSPSESPEVPKKIIKSESPRLGAIAKTPPNDSSKTEMTEEATLKNVASQAKTQDAAKGPKGFVYRAFMSATNVETTTGAVRDLILQLGGVKAGQVDLGWRKDTGTYFHFSIPESNYELLMTGLQTHSPVRIYKDPHWRVMPEGQIRLILFVEDLSLKK